MQALQTLVLLGDGASAPPAPLAPSAAGPAAALDLSNLATLLSMENAGAQLGTAPRPQVCAVASR